MAEMALGAVPESIEIRLDGLSKQLHELGHLRHVPKTLAEVLTALAALQDALVSLALPASPSKAGRRASPSPVPGFHRETSCGEGCANMPAEGGTSRNAGPSSARSASKTKSMPNDAAAGGEPAASAGSLNVAGVMSASEDSEVESDHCVPLPHSMPFEDPISRTRGCASSWANSAATSSWSCRGTLGTSHTVSTFGIAFRPQPEARDPCGFKHPGEQQEEHHSEEEAAAAHTGEHGRKAHASASDLSVSGNDGLSKAVSKNSFVSSSVADGANSMRNFSSLFPFLSLGESGNRSGERSFQALSTQRGSITETELAASRRCILQPDGRGRLAWDATLVLMVLFTGFAIPVKLAYLGGGNVGTGPLDILLQTVDVLWCFGIALNFFTGVMEADTAKLNFWFITVKYVKGWLYWDLLSAWPLLLVPRRTEGRAVWVLHCMKLFRLLRLGPLLWKFQKAWKIPTLLHAKFLLQITLLLHMMSCGWRLALGAEALDGEPVDRRSTMYVRDIYWVFMTITTVGYGDIVPKTSGARLYAVFSMLVATVFHSTIVSLFTHSTSAFFNDKVETNVADAGRFMHRRQVSRELRKRVELNLRRRMKMEQHMLSPELFAKLSPDVQRELSLALLSRVVLEFPLFQGARHSFIAEIAQAHSWVQCLPGDVVAEEGHLIQELIFVIHGRLLLHVGGGQIAVARLRGSTDAGPTRRGSMDSRAAPRDPVVTIEGQEQEIETGAWFGEECLFDSGRVFNGTAIAVVESEVAVLPCVEYRRICEKYPLIYKKHQEISDALTQGRLDPEHLAFHNSRRTQTAFTGPRMSFWTNHLWPLRTS